MDDEQNLQKRDRWKIISLHGSIDNSGIEGGKEIYVGECIDNSVYK